MKRYSVVAFIPARGGSQGIYKKNIRLLGEKPLIAYSIETALSCGLRTIVNTDDSEIAKIAREYGAEVMEMTTEEAKERGIHQHTSSMYDVLKSEIPRIKPIPTLVLLLQPTTPFRSVQDVKRIVDTFCLSFDNGVSEIDSMITVERVPEKFNPAQVIVGGKMADGRLIKDRIARRQDFQDAFIPTGSVYLFKTENLEKGSMYGDKVVLFETCGTININNMTDLREARAWLRNQK